MLLVRRREFLAAISLAAATQVAAQERQPDLRRVQAAVDSFARLPVTSSCFIATDHPTPWTVGHDPEMMIRGVPVTFCFTINWTGPADGVPSAFEAYKNSVAEALNAAAKAVA